MIAVLLIALCAVLLYVITVNVVELVRYESNLRKRIQFERLRARVVDNR